MSQQVDLTPAALYARVSSDRQDVDLSVSAFPNSRKRLFGSVQSAFSARRG